MQHLFSTLFLKIEFGSLSVFCIHSFLDFKKKSFRRKYLRKRSPASMPLVCAREGARMHVSEEFRPCRDGQLCLHERKKSPSRDPPPSTWKRAGDPATPEGRLGGCAVPGELGTPAGRPRGAQGPSFPQKPPASGAAAALPWQPWPAGPSSRAPGGAGRALLGDLQRASASAARSPGFHPSPTSAWQTEVGVGLAATWWPRVSRLLLSFERAAPSWPT